MPNDSSLRNVLGSFEQFDGSRCMVATVLDGAVGMACVLFLT